MVKATRDAALCQLWADLYTLFSWWCVIGLDAKEHSIAQLSSEHMDLTNNVVLVLSLVEKSHGPHQLMVHQYQ